jgi:hypothetical protein
MVTQANKRPCCGEYARQCGQRDTPENHRDVTWANDPEVLKFLAFLKKYNSDANPNDSLNVIAYVHAATVVAVLRLCGDDARLAEAGFPQPCKQDPQRAC